MDTHALSEPAQRTALEVLGAHGVDAADRRRRRLHAHAGHLARDPHATTAAARSGLADGIVITPSHNPPEDGGFKYNPPNGGPADTDVTGWIEERANELLAEATRVQRVPYERARAARRSSQYDFVAPYVARPRARGRPGGDPGARCGSASDPMGGADVGYWAPIADRVRARPRRS